MTINGPRATTRQLPSQDCDLVTVPVRQGLEAVDILRLRDGVGPVLHDGAGDTLGFVVPPGTADAWDLPGSSCTQTSGRRTRSGAAPGEDAEEGTRIPETTVGCGDVIRDAGDEFGRALRAGTAYPDGPYDFGDPGAPGTQTVPASQAAGTGWLVPPHAAYTDATDPADLRAALGEAARTIEAVDRCR